MLEIILYLCGTVSEIAFGGFQRRSEPDGRRTLCHGRYWLFVRWPVVWYAVFRRRTEFVHVYISSANRFDLFCVRSRSRRELRSSGMLRSEWW
jgi:hypothetical protein